MSPDLAVSLRELRDIHLPAAPAGELDLASFAWPAASALLVLAAVAILVVRIRGRLLRDARRQLAVSVAQHARSGDTVQLASELSQLLRRHARKRWGRGVDGLCGEAWLHFLDQHGEGTGFCQGPGRVLISVPFLPPGSRFDTDTTALVVLVRRWLETNR